ncbi:MAG: TetR/AcrR family transcriptional regulator [Clostridia bacterium]|nr:TetR/AcrR family transcriptional regulator [Clostridia bacterium]
MPDQSDHRIHDAMSDKIIETAEALVMQDGAEDLTVRKILRTLNITNRVFYNRFHNIGEVLEIVYRSTIMKVRESITPPADSRQDFFDYVIDVVANTLLISYDTKMRFNQYVFENDSRSQLNYNWWKAEISRIIDYAKQQHFIRDVDTDIMSYAIWCFIRGYNADAVGRNLPRDEAERNFRYSFRILLDGMKV